MKKELLKLHLRFLFDQFRVFSVDHNFNYKSAKFKSAKFTTTQLSDYA